MKRSKLAILMLTVERSTNEYLWTLWRQQAVGSERCDIFVNSKHPFEACEAMRMIDEPVVDIDCSIAIRCWRQ